MHESSLRPNVREFFNNLRDPARRAALGGIVISPLLTLLACGNESAELTPASTTSSSSGELVCVVDDPYKSEHSDDTSKVIEVSTSAAAHGKATGDYADANDPRCAKETSAEVRVEVCTLDGPHEGEVVELPIEEVDDSVRTGHYSRNLDDCEPSPSPTPR